MRTIINSKRRKIVDMRGNSKRNAANIEICYRFVALAWWEVVHGSKSPNRPYPFRIGPAQKNLKSKIAL